MIVISQGGLIMTHKFPTLKRQIRSFVAIILSLFILIHPITLHAKENDLLSISILLDEIVNFGDLKLELAIRLALDIPDTMIRDS